MGIFGGYDVRGIYGEDIVDGTAYALGRAFADFLKNKGTVVIGRDPRLSSVPLSGQLASGLADGGIDVVDVGLAATPVIYFAGAVLKAGATVCITASHNPPEYAGFKFCVGNRPLSSGELEALERIFELKKFVSARKAKITEHDVAADYIDYVAKRFPNAGSLKIVIDSGNGACGPVAVVLFEKMGCKVTGLFTEPDGTFPNHVADPHDKKNVVALQREVVAKHADLGIAFDGDGDRVYFVDEKGAILSGDVTGVLLVREVLRNGKAAVPFELRCSLVVKEAIEKAGGTPIMVAAGRVAVREGVAAYNAPLGLESSGHICLGENRGFDDGIYAAAKFVKMLAASGKKASALAASVPRYFSSVEYRLKVPAERKAEIVAGVKMDLAKRFSLNELDGVRIETSDYWGLLRASKTEPKISLRFEGKTAGNLDSVYGIFKKALKQQGVELPALEVE